MVATSIDSGITLGRICPVHGPIVAILPRQWLHHVFGAVSAKDRLDVVIRNAINAGDIPGSRYLANAKEISRTGGELVAGITAYAGLRSLRRLWLITSSSMPTKLSCPCPAKRCVALAFFPLCAHGTD
jgi:hypothetical protein